MRLTTLGWLALFLIGCGGDAGPARVEAEGAWSGPIQEGGSTIGQLSLTLVENSGTVTGSGNISGSGVAEAVTATGTYTEPSLSLILTAPGFNNLNLSAVVGATTMTGTLNGSGFVASAITLTRQ